MRIKAAAPTGWASTLRFLIWGCISAAQARDFDSTQTLNVRGAVNEVLGLSTQHARMIQTGVQHGFYLNGSTVDYNKLGHAMDSSIDVLGDSYYHVWASFENGGFIGYYQVDSLVSLFPESEGMYTVSFMPDINHACPEFNFTDAQWAIAMGTARNPTASNGSSSRSSNPIGYACREYFTASKFDGLHTGPGAASLGGAVYDPRRRGWYMSVKECGAPRWAKYIDRTTNEPAIAICLPMNNLTAAAVATSELMNGGLVGVTCGGVYVKAISQRLVEVVDSRDSIAFVRDRSTGLLLAAASDSGTYYHSSDYSYFLPSESPNPLILWAANQLGGYDAWPEGGTYVFSNGTDAYFINIERYDDAGLSLDLITMQVVDCNRGHELDNATLSCVPCVHPFTSRGGSGACVLCEAGFYLVLDESVAATGRCRECPEGSSCAGGRSLPRNLKGYWADQSDGGKHLTEFYACETLAGLSCLKDFTCLEGFGGRHCSMPAEGFILISAFPRECGLLADGFGQTVKYCLPSHHFSPSASIF